MRLKIKLALIICGMMVLVISLLSGVLLSKARTIQIKTTMEDMKSGSGLYAKELESYYERHMDTAVTIAQILSSFEKVDPIRRRDRFNEDLRAIIQQNEEITGIYALWIPGVLDGLENQYRNYPGSDENGNFVPFYTRESGEIELKAMPDYQNILLELSEENAVSDPEEIIIKGGSRFGVHFRTPIKDSQGNNAGVVGIIMDLSYSRNLVDSIVPYNAGQVEVYSNNSTIVAAHDKSGVGRHFQEVKIEHFGREGIKIIEESLSSGQPLPFRYQGLLVQAYPFYIGAASKPWMFIASVPVAVIMQDVNSMTKFAIILDIGALLISMAAATYIAYRITKPITGVSFSLKNISEGEGDLTRSISINQSDEIGEMARYFNLALEKIRTLIHIIKNQSFSLFATGNELSSNMSETTAAVNQIAMNIQNIKSRIIDQSASVAETHSIMELITFNIDKLNQQVERQSASVTKSSAAVEQMIANIQSVTKTLIDNASNVKNLAEASELGRISLQEVTSDIQEIGRESMGLQEINAVMENIAGQTNLLSMNAAIEAAHAGDAGRGFAVVAGEIRKLAEDSSEQSKTISNVLKKISNCISKISKSTSNVLDKFEAIDNGVKVVADQDVNIRKAMEEQNDGSHQILETLGQLNEITLKVRNGSVEMLENSKEIIEESKNLETLTQDITSGINEMAAGTNEINTAIHEVNTISGHNKDNIDILVKEISRFKVE